MTTYEPRHAADVRPATQDRWDANMAALTALLCARCEQLIIGTPVVDEQQELWLGDAASKWCSDTCRDDDAEDYWTSRWAVVA